MIVLSINTFKPTIEINNYMINISNSIRYIYSTEVLYVRHVAEWPPFGN